jgi:DNA-binding GntR family transcriptional regulator
MNISYCKRGGCCWAVDSGIERSLYWAANMRAMNNQKDGRGASKRRQPVALPLALSATNTIRDRILDLTLSPGMQLDEAILRDRLGVSRTPAREALNRLVTEGLVESRTNRGFFVHSLDLADTAQFFDAYIVSERSLGYFCRFANPSLVANLRSIQADHERAVKRDRFLDVSQHNAAFHGRIAEATENSYLAEFSGRLHNLARRLAYFVYANEADDQDALDTQQRHIIDEHHRIIVAIDKRDRAALLSELTSHAERFQHRIGRFVSRRDRDVLKFGTDASRSPNRPSAASQD